MVKKEYAQEPWKAKIIKQKAWLQAIQSKTILMKKNSSATKAKKS